MEGSFNDPRVWKKSRVPQLIPWCIVLSPFLDLSPWSTCSQTISISSLSMTKTPVGHPYVRCCQVGIASLVNITSTSQVGYCRYVHIYIYLKGINWFPTPNGKGCNPVPTKACLRLFPPGMSKSAAAFGPCCCVAPGPMEWHCFLTPLSSQRSTKRTHTDIPVRLYWHICSEKPSRHWEGQRFHSTSHMQLDLERDHWR